jgi:Chalcone isomerase-like
MFPLRTLFQPDALWMMALLSLVAVMALFTPVVVRAEASSRLAPTATVGTEQLRLIGSGVRTRLLISIYEAGIYATAPVHTAEALFALPGAKRLQAVALREIDAEGLGRLMMRGIADNNSREDAARQLHSIAQITSLFSYRRTLKRGDLFGFDFVPGQGTSLHINGVQQGELVRDPAFFPLVMRLWLGPQPADADLKAALLGQGAPARAAHNAHEYR